MECQDIPFYLLLLFEAESGEVMISNGTHSTGGQLTNTALNFDIPTRRYHQLIFQVIHSPTHLLHYDAFLHHCH